MVVESEAHARRAAEEKLMRRITFLDESAATQQQMIVYAIVGLISFSLISTAAWFALGGRDPGEIDIDPTANWIDPVIEIEDENHSHNSLIDHEMSTPNAQLIDYHNLNCDGNVKPPPELDNVAGRPCFPEYKNTAPTPGDNSEISIEGNFMDDCAKYPDGTGGCYAYVSSYNQIEILDISRPNNITLLSTYYAEIARIIDIKVTKDNNWVLINHELTNSELDPIPNDDDANSGTNRLDVLYVGNKLEPIKVAEWNNPPAGFHNQDLNVYCDWEPSNPLWSGEECHLFLYGSDPYPELVEGSTGTFYKGTQIFYVPLGFESWLPTQSDEQQNQSREIIRWGGLHSPRGYTLWWLGIQSRPRLFRAPNNWSETTLHLLLGCWTTNC